MFILCAVQALNLDSRNVEALSLKGLALMEVKKIAEAFSHFREALRLAPYRFEAYNSMLSYPRLFVQSECYVPSLSEKTSDVSGQGLSRSTYSLDHFSNVQ